MDKVAGLAVTRGGLEGPQLPLVVLPGFPGGSASVARLVEHLGRQRSTLVIDPLGCGKSDAPPDDDCYRWTAQCDRLRTVLDHFGIARADVVGMSLGAIWAQHFATVATARISRLTLACAPARLRARERAFIDHTLAQLSSNLALSEIARGMLSTQFSAEFLHRPGAMMILEHYLTNTTLTRRGFVGQLRAMRSHDHRAPLSDLRAPTLVIAGRSDWLFPLSTLQELQQLLQSSSLVVMDGGHTLWLEQHEQLAEVVIAASRPGSARS